MSDLQTLKEKRAALDAEIKLVQSAAVEEAEIQILQIANDVGVDLLRLAKKYKVKKLKKVRNTDNFWAHPQDNSLLWAGRGRKPLWLIEFLKTHQLADLVKKESANE